MLNKPLVSKIILKSISEIKLFCQFFDIKEVKNIYHKCVCSTHFCKHILSLLKVYMWCVCSKIYDHKLNNFNYKINNLEVISSNLVTPTNEV